MKLMSIADGDLKTEALGVWGLHPSCWAIFVIFEQKIAILAPHRSYFSAVLLHLLIVFKFCCVNSFLFF